MFVKKKLQNKNTDFGSLQVVAIWVLFVPDPLKDDKGEYIQKYF